MRGAERAGMESVSVYTCRHNRERGQVLGPTRTRCRSSAVLAILLTALSLGLAACSVPRVGSFVPTGSLITGRSSHTATLMQDGRVLIAGGEQDTLKGNGNTTTYLASVELYDPTSGKFSLVESMTTPRSGHSATLLSDGRVLIAGGYDGVGNAPLASAELYDPTSGKFSLVGSMTTPRSSHSATLLSDGQVLITGGAGPVSGSDPALASAELYDPKTGTFSPTRSMSRPRLGNTATLLLDGRVLVAGGYVGTLYNPGFDSAELYDPKSGSFSPTGSMSESRALLTGTLLRDGRVLIADDTDGSADLYDPKTGTFSLTGLMTYPGIGGAAALLSDGRVLIGGGSCTAEGCEYPQVFDPGSDSFRATGDDTKSPPNRHATLTLLKDGRVLFAGGGFGELDTAAELFVP